MSNEMSVVLYDQKMIPEDQRIEFFKVRSYTLEELLEKCEEMRYDLNLAKDKEDELRKNVQWVNADNLRYAKREYGQDSAEYRVAYETYKEQEQEYIAHCERVEIMQDALTGMRGAVDYYAGLRLNEAFAKVLPKYSGKKAGPKTTEKFWKEIAECFPMKVRCWIDHNHVTVYGKFIDGVYYSIDPLTDNDNRFVETFETTVPHDEYNGRYPDNWMLWAAHVRAANVAIKQKFEEFCSMQDALVHSLKIGDVGMNRVYAYTMKKVK